MKTIMAFVMRRPVLTYFVLTFVISWGIVLLLVGSAPLSGNASLSDPRFMLALLVGPFAPALVSLLLTGIVFGRTGYQELRARLCRWRVRARWYAVALVPAPLVAAATGILLAVTLGSSKFLPAIVTTNDPLGLLLPGMMIGLLVGLGEELGWTGFAIPALRRQYGAATTGLLVGLVWGAWHFPLFRESDSFAGVLPLALLLVALFSWLPAYRILMVWVYDRTGSLLVAILMHVSLSATQVILLPSNLSDTQSLISMLARSSTWWIIVAAIALANRRRFLRQALPRGVA